MKYNRERNTWLNCHPKICARGTCPLQNFLPNKHGCHGEIFYIYNEFGGYVKSGDRVGLYYPREKLWFGCPHGNYCNKKPCPGKPNYKTGFENRAKWDQCWGEVFKIYAVRRHVGEPIQEYDSIMLYYVREKKWVSLAGGRTDKRPCPGTPPPSDNKFEACWGEAFQLVPIDF